MGLQKGNNEKELQEAIGRLGLHDHLCLIYETREEQFSSVIPFIRIGLERGERCVYIIGENTVESVLDAMERDGIDTAGALESGALVIAAEREAYLPHGYFDPDLAIRFLKENTDTAIKAGYSALRVTGEMTWALGDYPGADRLIEYEARLNYFLTDERALAICQYNRNRFKPEIILDVIKTHPDVIYGNIVCDNQFYVPPDEFLRPGQQGLEVDRLLGAISSRAKRTAELKRTNALLQREINERRRVEEMARESEEKFRIIADNTYDWEFWLGTDGNYIYVSPSCERISGHSPGEFLADPGLRMRLIHPEDKPAFMEHLHNVEKKEPGEVEYRIFRPDGSIRWVGHACQPIHGRNGEFLGTRGSNRDITESKLSSDALEASERKYKALFDSMLNGFSLHEIILDEDGRPCDYRFLDVNRAFEELTGLRKEDIVGKRVLEVLPETERYWIDIFGEVAINGKAAHFENYSKEFGKYFEVVAYSPFKGVFATVFADITARKTAEEALRRHKEELESLVKDRTAELVSANASLRKEVAVRMGAEDELRKAVDALARSNKDLEQFAYIASHDLQEPLRMVSGFLQLLESRYRGRLDESADMYIHYAVDGAKRMHSLIEDLLHYSRVATRGKSFEPLDCNLVFQKVLQSLAFMIEESGAVIENTPLPVLAADESQIFQLFQNLLSNAIKFRKPGEPPLIRVSAELRDGEWIFSVRDEGIGIDPEYKERIFTLFQRLHGKEYPGSGIGLAVCKRIIERHNGRIWVESAPGKGAEFLFTIPEEIKDEKRKAA
ncbi:MAG: MEDS domain-containing protein [Deltaproteobacteria bacterium]|nr:MEDS domain-containing protein [Deltaproteobacteria bacterium]MBZ0219738.1 MEDS domain-containing protein [Deltaproteobacteria bacterium]